MNIIAATVTHNELRSKDLAYAREIDKLFDDMVGDYVTHDENGDVL